jgi:mannose-6-phosphate isomerase-like protein (cupin superfamily)
VSILVINIKEKFSKIEQLHKYKRIARMNKIDFKLVRMKREFIWHKHPETDEVFMVIDGSLQIHLRDKTLNLEKGEMVVIPKGVEHKPASQSECKILLIEPAATVNTGDAGGALTDDEVEWI